MEIRIQFGSFFLFPRTQKDFSAKIFAGQIPREIGSSDRPSFFSVKKRRRDKNFDKFSFSIFEEKNFDPILDKKMKLWAFSFNNVYLYLWNSGKFWVKILTAENHIWIDAWFRERVRDRERDGEI